MIRNHSRHGSRFPITLGGGGYSVNKSLRFRSSASAYLNRTFGTPTNNIKWTWSAWVKRGKLGSAGVLFQGYSSLSNRTALQFNSSDQLVFNGTVATATTTAVFRDPAAWYHIVCVYDSANATAANRLLLYVNGTVQTVTGTQPTASQVEYINGAWLHYISTGYSGAFEYLDEDLAEINFVDGQALAPTAFGAYSIYNQWLPIRYAGTYGTNGFYLPFNATSTTSYAGSFNGSNQYLNVNSVTAVGTGDFTVEAFVYFNALGDAALFQLDTAGLITNWSLSLDATANKFRFFVRNDAATTNADILSSAAAVTKQWYHVAGVVSGTTATLYVNGISVASATLSGVRTGTGTTIFMGQNGASGGRFLNGYMSNNRYVKGTAVYTANFIPPTANLTNITNTVLLTLQNATIVDNSSNGYTVVNNNTVVTSVQSPFLNTTVLTTDSSGNGNNWTPNNISLTAGSTYDSLTDVPTLTSTTVANYCVLNPLQNGAGTLSGGNLNLLGASANWGTRLGTIAVTSGKWYFEVTPTSGSATQGIMFGITQETAPAGTIAGTNGYSYYGNNGYKYNNNNAGVAYGATVADNDVVGVAFDVTAGTLTFYKNNISQGVAFSSLAAGTWFLGISCYGTATASINFGQQPFVYPTLPSGFLPLNTFNIAAGTVTTSGTFTGNLSADGPMVYLNGTPTAMTINGNAVTFGTHADKLANGFKVRSSSASYNTAGSNTYVATTVGAVFRYEDAQGNP